MKNITQKPIKTPDIISLNTVWYDSTSGSIIKLIDFEGDDEFPYKSKNIAGASNAWNKEHFGERLKPVETECQNVIKRFLTWI